MIRRPPRSTLDRSSAASDVYKRQARYQHRLATEATGQSAHEVVAERLADTEGHDEGAVSYTHLRAHETVLDLVCRLLLEKKNQSSQNL